MLADFNLNFSLTPAIAIGLVIIFLLFIFISGMAIYSLIHFGRSRILGVAASAAYSLLVLLLLVHALISLNNL